MTIRGQKFGDLGHKTTVLKTIFFLEKISGHTCLVHLPGGTHKQQHA